MQSKQQMIRIAMRLTESIIEILKEEFSEKKVRTNENGQKKKVKAGGQRNRKNTITSYGFGTD